jgi:hypothetical protein
MPKPNASNRAARGVAWTAAAIIVAGILLLVGSYLLHSEKPIAGTPSPRALFHATTFALRPRQAACMNSITLPPNGRTLQLELGETAASSANPPLDVVLSAPGYRETSHLGGGEAEGPVQLPVRPPHHFVIGSACLVNRGTTSVQLVGSTEERSRSRIGLTIDGHQVDGGIALTFFGSHSQSRLGRLGEAFEHASNLTDGLIPVWLIWIIAIYILLAVSLGTVLAVRRAMVEDESLPSVPAPANRSSRG